MNDTGRKYLPEVNRYYRLEIPLFVYTHTALKQTCACLIMCTPVLELQANPEGLCSCRGLLYFY